MKQMKRVMFCGHRELTAEEKTFLKERLYDKIEKLILQGTREFLLGGYGDFDLLSARVIKKLQTKYPHIRSVLVLAYLHQKYDETLYDETEYPPLENVPKPFAILRRNKYMVENADAVVSYVIYSFGGAAQTYQYALKKQKTVICISNCNKKRS